MFDGELGRAIANLRGKNQFAAREDLYRLDADLDLGSLIGGVAASPVKGLEPVHVIGPLAPRTIKSLALKPGEVRPLGWKWPRRWLALAE